MTAAKPWRRRMRRRALVLLPALLAPACPPPAAVAQPAPAAPVAIDVAQLAEQNLAADRAALRTAPAQADRDEAARRLSARRDRRGRPEVLAALADRRDLKAQLAAARAVAEDPAPDPAAVAPLTALLGVPGNSGLEGRLTETAVLALMNVRTPAAVAELTNFVRNPNALSRATAIRALGAGSDLWVAQLLAGVAMNPADPHRNFAFDALADLSGLSDSGRDPARWVAWTAGLAQRNPDQFRAEVLDRRRRRPAAPLADADELVNRLFQLVPREGQADAILRILGSPDAPLRLAGVRVADRAFNANGRLPGAPEVAGAPDRTRDRLREMVRDSAAEVRADVARLLGYMNDKPALGPLLAQLAVEPEPAVREAIARALVPLADPRAVPSLIAALRQDPSHRVQTAAAETIAKLGPVIRVDPPLAAAAVTALVATIADLQRADSPAAVDLKAAAAQALVPLRARAQQDLFLRLAVRQSGQAPRVRQAAVQALGELEDPNLADAVWDLARAQDEDPLVRVTALATLPRLDQGRYADGLFQIAGQAGERAEVRAAANGGFVASLRRASVEQLSTWDKRLRETDPGTLARRLPILTERLAREEQASDLRQAALTRQSIGDVLVPLGRPAEAVPYYRSALDYWSANRGTDTTIKNLRAGLLGALLAAKMYPDAVGLAQATLAADPNAEGDVVIPLMLATARLVETRQYADAQRLATEALKIPRMQERFREDLQQKLNAARQASQQPSPQQPPPR